MIYQSAKDLPDTDKKILRRVKKLPGIVKVAVYQDKGAVCDTQGFAPM